MLECLLLTEKKGDAPPGQALLQGTNEILTFKVPDGVRSISVVTIGTGYLANTGGSGSSAYVSAGAGGGLSYKNNIPVTPGETLTINFNSLVKSIISTVIYRGSVNDVLCHAGNGSGTGAGGLGGKAISQDYDGGGNGGASGNTTAGSGGGGAGGYSGNGGRGAFGGQPAEPGQGGGGGGGGQGSRNSVGNGGGTHPYGLGANGVKGENVTTSTNSGGRGSYLTGTTRNNMFGGGSSSAFAYGRGCVRIIWGENREFPSLNTEDVV